MNTQKLYRVLDSSGEDFFVAAKDMKEAYDKFRAWESANLFEGLPLDEIEEPQSISPAGELIPA